MDADVAQVHPQLEARVRDLEASTYCTMFLPRESEVVKAMQNAGRIYSHKVENQPSVERGVHTFGSATRR